jgi:glucuronate isomerase
MPRLNPDRLFPPEPQLRALARAIFDSAADAPILSPHGHTDPRWFAEDAAFPDPTQLFVIPDHYVFRMLHSQGVPLESLGIAPQDGGPAETDLRRIWQTFADHYHLFRGTPSRLWLDHAFATVFGIEEDFGPATAMAFYDRIAEALTTPAFRPRALYKRFDIEALATTEGALDDLRWHKMIRDSGWDGRVITTYRPDAVTDPDTPDFHQNVESFCAMAGTDPGSFARYLDAHRDRRAYFRDIGGATATDHGHPTATTRNLSPAATEALYQKVLSGRADAAEREDFRGQMLTEMAKLSLEDGMVMQIHPGSFRNHSTAIFDRFGRDKGFDIPTRTDYVRDLRPLLDAIGHERDLRIILFTLDETAYARELAPLAGVYPCLRLGPAWWFHDSFEGMWRYRQMTTETAGFYNTTGFNDDTRAYLSIPARHDVARRVDAAYLATLVGTGRLSETDAFDLMQDLTHRLARQAYRL